MKAPEKFSWSQYSLWKQSKYQWYKTYVIGEEKKSNKYFDKGKLLAEALDTGIIPEWNDDDMLPVLLKVLPKLELTEELIEVEIKNGKKIKCYIDTSNRDGKLFYDYKTGKNEWDIIDTIEHKQLLFYALAYYIRSGRKVVPDSGIIWVETIEQDYEGYNKVFFTGVFKLIERPISEDEIIAFEDEIIAVQNEIENYEYIETEIDDNLFNELISINEQLNTLDKRKKEISKLLLSLIESDLTNKGVCSFGYVNVVEKKEWIFSQNYEKIEGLFKLKLDKLAAKEKNTNVARQEVKTKYITAKKY